MPESGNVLPAPIAAQPRTGRKLKRPLPRDDSTHAAKEQRGLPDPGIPKRISPRPAGREHGRMGPSLSGTLHPGESAAND